MKKIYIKTAIVLASICAVCGIAIGAVNEVTAPIIAQNKIDKENKALKEICPNGEFKELLIDKAFTYVKKVYSVTNADVKTRIYTLEGKNAYGTIGLMAGLKENGVIFKVVTMQNTESYGSTVDDFISATFSKSVSNVSDIDVKCGATYGAKLVRDMLNEACEDMK